MCQLHVHLLRKKKKPLNYLMSPGLGSEKKKDETIFREADTEQEVRQRLPAKRLTNGVNFVFLASRQIHTVYFLQRRRGEQRHGADPTSE